jgi:hypothetical protein
MSDAGYIAVRTLPRISPEQACDARARAWNFIFECFQNNKAAETISGEGDADLKRRLRTAKEVKPGTT